MYVRTLVVATSLSLLGSTLGSDAAPAELRGKSVIVKWTENRVQRTVGETAWRSISIGHELRVYVSAAGRVFSRLINSGRGGSGTNDQVSGSQGSTRTPQFSGQSMVITGTGMSQGARRTSVTFSGGFSGCSAEVIRGKEVGAAVMTATSSINGKRLEIQSLTVGGVSCSVQAGNVFGSES